MKTIIGVIPARFASSRFPGKPLAMIKGRPMIQWVIEGARSSRLLSQVVVATDDELIRKAVEEVGAEAVMTPSALPSGTDRIEAALRGKKADLVVNIQGDEPLIKGSMIDALVQPLLDRPDLEMSTLAHTIERKDLTNNNAVKVIVNHLHEALYFSRFPVPYSRELPKEGEPICYRHLGLYGYRRDFLTRFCQTPVNPLEDAESLEQLRALWMGAKIHVVLTQERSWGVDTPADLAKVEKNWGT